MGNQRQEFVTHFCCICLDTRLHQRANIARAFWHCDPSNIPPSSSLSVAMDTCVSGPLTTMKSELPFKCSHYRSLRMDLCLLYENAECYRRKRKKELWLKKRGQITKKRTYALADPANPVVCNVLIEMWKDHKNVKKTTKDDKTPVKIRRLGWKGGGQESRFQCCTRLDWKESGVQNMRPLHVYGCLWHIVWWSKKYKRKLVNARRHPCGFTRRKN